MKTGSRRIPAKNTMAKAVVSITPAAPRSGSARIRPARIESGSRGRKAPQNVSRTAFVWRLR